MNKLPKEQQEKLEALVDEFKCPFQADDTCVSPNGIRSIMQKTIDILRDTKKEENMPT